MSNLSLITQREEELWYENFVKSFVRRRRYPRSTKMTQFLPPVVLNRHRLRRHLLLNKYHHPSTNSYSQVDKKHSFSTFLFACFDFVKENFVVFRKIFCYSSARWFCYLFILRNQMHRTMRVGVVGFKARLKSQIIDTFFFFPDKDFRSFERFSSI